VRPNTKLFFGETVGNPGLDVLDIPTVSQIAHEAGVPLLVDSTLTSPWLIKPFEHGADIVYHSATKFLSGHGTVIGGIVVDGGSFDWEKSGRFPELTQPYDGFHNMVFSEESTTGAFLLRAPRRPARLRRLHEPAQRLADPAGHRDPAAAHGAPYAQHRKSGAVPGQPPAGQPRGPPMLETHPSRAGRKLLPRGAARCSALTLPATATRARSSSKR
jgi:O-acetylhomoserine (thiol)-lyase